MTYLVRINLDIKEKNFADTLRFKVAASSLKSLSKKTNKIVILSHRGRPRNKEKELSLRKFAPTLAKTIRKKVKFIPHFKFDEIKEHIKNSPNGTVFLLENLRYLPGEEKNSRRLAKNLASLGGQYINNDFATSHRKHASIVAITRFIPSKLGQVPKDEIRALIRVTKKTKKPFILIVGGAKAEDKLSVVKNLLKKTDRVLLGGRCANTFLKARGVNVERSKCAEGIAKEIKRLAKKRKILTPHDWVSERGCIMDIGPKTARDYSQIIKSARTIVWGGPMGVFEKKRFAKGNEKIARAILKNKRAHTVIGGIETVSSLPKGAVNSKRGNLFISTGGGAMLYFLAGKKMPGLDALKRK
jgi:3-phosphoglycerate kinase